MRLTVNQIARYQNYLIEQKEERVKQQERVSVAASQGDLSENAEFDAANLELAKINSRISLLEEALADYTVIDRPKNINIISIGSIVKLSILGTGVDGKDISTGIRTLDRDQGEYYEIVEVSTISIPRKDSSDTSNNEEYVMELTTSSLVGRLLLGKTYNVNGDNIYPYRDNDNASRKLILMEVKEG